MITFARVLGENLPVSADVERVCVADLGVGEAVRRPMRSQVVRYYVEVWRIVGHTDEDESFENANLRLRQAVPGHVEVLRHEPRRLAPIDRELAAAPRPRAGRARPAAG